MITVGSRLGRIYLRYSELSVAHPRLLVWLLLLPAAVLAYCHRDLPLLGAYHDDGVYFVTGKAIAAGHGYRLESLPGENWATKYPPLFPVALAAVWAVAPQFPANILPALTLVWLALPVALWLMDRMLRSIGLPAADRVLVCMMVLANQAVLMLSVSVLSDLWFCCEVLMAVWLAERASTADAGWRTAACAAIAAAAAYLTKSSGVVLLASAGFVMLRERRFRNAAVFAGVFLPVIAAWTWWSGTHTRPVTDCNDIFYFSTSGNWPPTLCRLSPKCFPAWRGGWIVLRSRWRVRCFRPKSCPDPFGNGRGALPDGSG